MRFYKGHYGFQDIHNIQVLRMFLKHTAHVLTVKNGQKVLQCAANCFFPLFEIPIPFLSDELFYSYVSV